MSMITEHDPVEYIVPLIKEVVSGFIGHPDQLEVLATRVGTILDIRLNAHIDDYPKIVGKMGRNVASLNEIFGAVGRRAGLSVVLGVPDRTERSHPANRGFINDPKWPRDEFKRLLMDVLNSLCDKEPEIYERINPAKKMRMGNGEVTLEESSVFFIKPAYCDLEIFKREIEIALEVVFRAIGQQQGRRINLGFIDVGEGEHSTQGGARTDAENPRVKSPANIRA